VTGGDPTSEGNGTVVGVTSPFVLDTASASAQVAFGDGATLRSRIMMRDAGVLVAEKTVDEPVIP